MQPVISQDDLRVLRQVHGPEGDGLDVFPDDQTRLNLPIHMIQDGAVASLHLKWDGQQLDAQKVSLCIRTVYHGTLVLS